MIDPMDDRQAIYDIKRKDQYMKCKEHKQKRNYIADNAEADIADKASDIICKPFHSQLLINGRIIIRFQ